MTPDEVLVKVDMGEFWTDGERSEQMGIVHQLEDAGLIKICAVGVDGTALWRLTQLGYRALRS